ncbi:MAG TPA: YceH family protein, partial [Solirubrobacteraceae bacterium]|nr:YceH family protein [Solirubrobacteraceae bacterium]
MDLEPAEVRVLGCLIEKQRTTPDVYPLSLNALRAACNQSTNRDPVVAYDDDTLRDALHRLGRRGWTRLASGARAAKYRHLLDEKPGLARDEQAVLAVLMLRGPQTLGELRTRTERMQPFADTAELQSVLGRLAERGFAELQERRPGQKEQRYAHLLSSDLEDDEEVRQPAPAPAATWTPPSQQAPAPAPQGDPLAERVERLEQDLAALA